MSDEKASPNSPGVDFTGGKTIEEATEEVKELLIGEKTIEEATEEVIKELGGRMSNDKIHKLFD